MMSTVNPFPGSPTQGSTWKENRGGQFTGILRFLLWVKALPSHGVCLVFQVDYFVVKNIFKLHKWRHSSQLSCFRRLCYDFVPVDRGTSENIYSWDPSSWSHLRGPAGGHSVSACWRQILFQRRRGDNQWRDGGSREATSKELLPGNLFAPLMRSHQHRSRWPHKQPCCLDRRWRSQYIRLRISMVAIETTIFENFEIAPATPDVPDLVLCVVKHVCLSAGLAGVACRAGQRQTPEIKLTHRQTSANVFVFT